MLCPRRLEIAEAMLCPRRLRLGLRLGLSPEIGVDDGALSPEGGPAKQIYSQRSSIAEFPNAYCRNQGLYQFRGRGLTKVKAEALWHALTFNFRRMLNLKYFSFTAAG